MSKRISKISDKIKKSYEKVSKKYSGVLKRLAESESGQDKSSQKSD